MNPPKSATDYYYYYYYFIIIIITLVVRTLVRTNYLNGKVLRNATNAIRKAVLVVLDILFWRPRDTLVDTDTYSIK